MTFPSNALCVYTIQNTYIPGTVMIRIIDIVVTFEEYYDMITAYEFGQWLCAGRVVCIFGVPVCCDAVYLICLFIKHSIYSV